MNPCKCKINFNKPRPITYWLPFHYHLVPGVVRAWIATNIFKMTKINNEDHLCQCQVDISKRIVWPELREMGFSLSYDVDSISGLRKLKQLKNDPFFGKIKSTVNIVSHHYKFTSQEIEELKSASWEIAVHGDNHDSKLAFVETEQIETRLLKSRLKFQNMGIDVRGFRSPSLFYTERFIRVLSQYFKYDSSMYFDDGEFGISKIFPFRLYNLLEIPITMTMDVHFRFLRISEEDKMEHWLKRFHFIKKHKGYALLVIHPDEHFFSIENEKTLRRFLCEVQSNNAWIATCGEVFDFFDKFLDQRDQPPKKLDII